MRIFLLSIHACGASSRALFDHARVAVLLTGEAFRTQKRQSTDQSKSCANESYEAQRSASNAVLTQAILPLESHGARVDVLFTFPPCGTTASGGVLLRKLQGWYGERVVAHRVISHSRNVGHSWQLAFMLLRDHMRAKQPADDSVSSTRAALRYDFVLSIRHDMMLLRPLLGWPADLSHLLFTGLRGTLKVDCDFGDRSSCSVKGNDKLLWTPRRWLPRVLRLLAHDDEHGDSDFNPHYFAQHFVNVPSGALTRRYHNHGLINASCAGDGVHDDGGMKQPIVPAHARLTFAPAVGILAVCDGDPPIFRFSPDRH